MKYGKHIRTGFPCRIMSIANGKAFCNFGNRLNPFTWVLLSELIVYEKAV